MEDIKIGSFEFRILSENKVELDWYLGEQPEIEIPSKVEYEGKEYIVTSIGDGALEYDREITSVIIPDSVTEIGEAAFRGCRNLTSVIIGNNVTAIGWQAFEGCKSLTSIVIPESVTYIGRSPFKDCENLKSIVIGDKVRDIKDFI